MRKKIEILGRKIPIVAILIALLVIGTASAAVFEHYATMEGSITIESPMTITYGTTEIPLGDSHTFTIDSMSSPCTISETFEFNNTHGSAVNVSIFWILYEAGVNYEELETSGTYWIYDNETYSVPENTTFYTATLDVPAYITGDHVFRIEVNPVFT